MTRKQYCVCAQWAVVGDTFPVGCKFQNSIVFRDSSFMDNPDDKNPLYKSVLVSVLELIGINVMLAWLTYLYII